MSGFDFERDVMLKCWSYPGFFIIVTSMVFAWASTYVLYVLVGPKDVYLLEDFAGMHFLFYIFLYSWVLVYAEIDTANNINHSVASLTLLYILNALTIFVIWLYAAPSLWQMIVVILCLWIVPSLPISYIYLAEKSSRIKHVLAIISLTIMFTCVHNYMRYTLDSRFNSLMVSAIIVGTSVLLAYLFARGVRYITVRCAISKRFPKVLIKIAAFLSPFPVVFFYTHLMYAVYVGRFFVWPPGNVLFYQDTKILLGISLVFGLIYAKVTSKFLSLHNHGALYDCKDTVYDKEPRRDLE